MPEVFFNCEVACPFEKKDFLSVIKAAAKAEKKIRGIVEITVVSEATIKRLNKEHRNKNAVTDVLSFSMIEGGRAVGPFLGEIYICYKQIVRQARQFKVKPAEEFNRMLVHGLLHLVGYDHVKENDANKMYALQEKIIFSKKNKKK